MKKNKNAVQQLRKAGNRVRVYHERLVAPNKKELIALVKPVFVHIKKGEHKKLDNFLLEVSPVILNHGGRTTVTVTSKSGANYEASARTSKKDCFNRKSGLGICLTRIFSQAAKSGESLV